MKLWYQHYPHTEQLSKFEFCTIISREYCMICSTSQGENSSKVCSCCQLLIWLNQFVKSSRWSRILVIRQYASNSVKWKFSTVIVELNLEAVNVHLPKIPYWTLCQCCGNLMTGFKGALKVGADRVRRLWKGTCCHCWHTTDLYSNCYSGFPPVCVRYANMLKRR